MRRLALCFAFCLLFSSAGCAPATGPECMRHHFEHRVYMAAHWWEERSDYRVKFVCDEWATVKK